MEKEQRREFEQDVQQRLVAVEGKFDPIAAQLSAIFDTQKELLNEQRSSSKTQWAPLLTALTLVVVIMGYLGTLTVAPIKDRQELLIETVNKLEARTYEERLSTAREAGETEARLEALAERIERLED